MPFGMAVPRLHALVERTPKTIGGWQWIGMDMLLHIPRPSMGLETVTYIGVMFMV